jgi:uncharacterized protein (TIGR02117 family)
MIVSKPLLRLIWRILRNAVFVVLVCVFTYGVAAMILALLPLSGRQQVLNGTEPPVFVCANSAHSDLVLPLTDPLVEWQQVFDLTKIKKDHPDAYLAIGWGDLVFFQETPTWGDLTFSNAISALAGVHATTVRVIVQRVPHNDPECAKLAVDADARRALIDHVLSTLDQSVGTPLPQLAGGTKYEQYYSAKGRYGPFQTCNQWVADGLAKAQLPHAILAPFSFSVTWPLKKIMMK